MDGIPLPVNLSNVEEIERLTHLHIANLGTDAPASKITAHGIFSHHGNTPHGIRLAVEYAMRNNLIRFVVCTSTLAQGVNLPIRYLIVASIYQGRERIKVRDFHNLLGRAGRAGMHTEGSILFADPIIYDKRKARKDKWRWNTVKELLDPAKSEECVSSLFQLIPLVLRNDKNASKDRKDHQLTWDIMSFAKIHIAGQSSLNQAIAELAKKHAKEGFTSDTLKYQFEFFSLTLSSIESFLLSNWDTDEDEFDETSITNLAEQTLAYFLADNEKREEIQELFKLLAKNISEKITDANQREAFGRTLYGINDAKAIEVWVHAHKNELISAKSGEEIIDVIWPLITMHIHNGTFNKFNNNDILKTITKKWISGDSFHELFLLADENECKLGTGNRPRKIKIESIVEICESGISYDGALLVSALCEFLEMLGLEESDDAIKRLQLFQKQLKYGLPTETTIALYELGFSDRVISQDLARNLVPLATDKRTTIEMLKRKRGYSIETMKKYPEYFQIKLNDILAK